MALPQDTLSIKKGSTIIVMTRDNELPILIIGAGIGGLVAALALQQAGFAVRVFERAYEIREVGAGLTLWPNAVKVLQRLGLDEMLRDLGLPETAMSGFYSAQGKLLASLSPAEIEDKLGAPTIVIHRAEFQAALREKVGPDALQLGARFVAFEQDENGITASFADRQRVRGRLLIGADGIHSSIRQQLFPQSIPRYAGYTAWRGVAAAVPQMIGEFWGRGLRFGIAPLSRERVYWFASRNASENATETSEGRREELLAMFKYWHPAITTLIEATPVEEILHNDIYDLKPLSHWSEGRVVLLGDAAHAMTPNMGQGACQALEDAFVLAQALWHTQSIAEALHVYQQKRLARANMVITRSRQIGIIGQWEHPFACWLRDRALMLTPRHLLIRQLASVASHTPGE